MPQRPAPKPLLARVGLPWIQIAPGFRPLWHIPHQLALWCPYQAQKAHTRSRALQRCDCISWAALARGAGMHWAHPVGCIFGRCYRLNPWKFCHKHHLQ
jgi:hypothetical protein